MRTPDEVRAAFAQLPPEVTAKQIAQATGRTHIHNWTDPSKGFTGFPAARRIGRAHYRDRDEVLEWYLRQPFAGPGRRGPRDLTDTARTARPERVLLSAGEIAAALHITPGAVYKLADRHPTGCADPFPPADSDGRRSWSAVRAWLLRQGDPLPAPDEAGRRAWTDLQPWLLRNHLDATGPNDRPLLDELGLTLGRRDLLERARTAAAAASPAPAPWLAEHLGLPDTGQAALLVSGAGHRTRRLRPTALARALGVSVDTVKHYARTRTPLTCEDPFPAKDGSSARDIDEVRTWLSRHHRGNPDQAPPEDPAAP